MAASQNGYGEEPEWGAITDPAGYRYLKVIDSYQAVKDGAPYPAVLPTTGVTDPRIAPFHVAKMTARLQAASSSGKPILLRVDYDAGHVRASAGLRASATAASASSSSSASLSWASCCGSRSDDAPNGMRRMPFAAVEAGA